MTQVDSKVDRQTTGIIDIIPSEIEDFEQEVKRFQAGEWDETDFQAFRLRQGVYGQRQPDVHMIRIKFPFGGMTSAQLDMLGEIVEKYAPLNKGHVTTRENIQLHHVPLLEAAEVLKMPWESCDIVTGRTDLHLPITSPQDGSNSIWARPSAAFKFGNR